jgi:predicted TPR repeat methyltransferase
MLQEDFQTARQFTQDEQIHDAILLYEKILQDEPLHVPSHYNLALLAVKTGDTDKARVHFEQVLKLVPEYPQGHFQMAQLLLFLQKPLDAISELNIAVDLQPNYIDARHLLACTLMQQHQEALATEQFQILFQYAPQHANGHLNFALLKLHQKDLTTAKTLLETAISLDPTLIEAHYHRGVIAMQQGDIERAIIEMQGTLDRQDDHFAANYNLAILYKMQHHYKLAIFYLKKAQALEPDNESIAFLLNAFEQHNIPAQAPKTFVQELFNHYADTYDEHMEQTLKYKTPQQLRTLLNPFIEHLPKNPIILDLGCGTGLIGKYFQDLNATFIGIDLADEMLTRAKQKNIYQKLVNADILEYLNTTQEKFDLIIASDVLNYFGDLNPIFTACKQVLNPKGLLLFSIELTESHDYLLHNNARFAHNVHYIDGLANAQHWQLLAETKHTLRMQENKPVLGQVFIYTKRIEPLY